MSGASGLVARLLYGTGLRLMEGVRLCLKGVDFARGEIVVRDGWGMKGRVPMLPQGLVWPLELQLESARVLHNTDLCQGCIAVYLPFALERKCPNAGREWAQMRAAARQPGLRKPATSHTLRHYFTTHLLEGGIRTVQELLGHKEVSTTMICTRVLNRGGRGVWQGSHILRSSPA